MTKTATSFAAKRRWERFEQDYEINLGDLQIKDNHNDSLSTIATDVTDDSLFLDDEPTSPLPSVVTKLPSLARRRRRHKETLRERLRHFKAPLPTL